MAHELQPRQLRRASVEHRLAIALAHRRDRPRPEHVADHRGVGEDRPSGRAAAYRDEPRAARRSSRERAALPLTGGARRRPRRRAGHGRRGVERTPRRTADSPPLARGSRRGSPPGRRMPRRSSTNAPVSASDSGRKVDPHRSQRWPAARRCRPAAPVEPCRPRASGNCVAMRREIGRRRPAGLRPPNGGPRGRRRPVRSPRGRAGTGARPRRPPRGSAPTRSRSRRAAGAVARSQSRSALAGRTASSFAVATSGSSPSRIPAWALTISPSAQNVTPSPYGRQRPCAPRRGPERRPRHDAAARRRSGSCRSRARRRRARTRAATVGRRSIEQRRAAGRARRLGRRTRRRGSATGRCRERSRTPVAWKTRTGSALPLSVAGGSSAYSTADPGRLPGRLARPPRPARARPTGSVTRC